VQRTECDLVAVSVRSGAADRAAAARVAIYDQDGFPMMQFDSDGNIRHKGSVQRTLVG